METEKVSHIVTFSLYWDKYNKRINYRFLERTERDEEQILNWGDSMAISLRWRLLGLKKNFKEGEGLQVN